MRIDCPGLGPRDLREFVCRGRALPRPDGEDWSEVWDDYLHLRENPAGWTEEHWYHIPSGTWLVVERNTVTHEVRAVRSAAEAT